MSPCPLPTVSAETVPGRVKKELSRTLTVTKELEGEEDLYLIINNEALVIFTNGLPAGGPTAPIQSHPSILLMVSCK